MQSPGALWVCARGLIRVSCSAAASERGWRRSSSDVKMKVDRKDSVDSVSESSGYCSNVEAQHMLGRHLKYTRQCLILFLLFLDSQCLNLLEAQKILNLNRSKGFPLLACKNSIRGCPVNSFPRVVGLHEEMCKFPEIRKLTVKSKLNLLQADMKKFRMLNNSFEKSRKVVFLFKMTKDSTSIKVCAQHYGDKENSFILTFYDKKERHIHKISDKTGLKIHTIPAIVFREVGSLVKYKIQISK